MRHAIDVAPLGDLSDPRRVIELARAAERAGWDGISTWDNIGNSMGTGVAELFVTLGAVAASTERLRLIASAVIVPRRRPQLVAQAAATLDVLSGGRFTLGVAGGGDPPEFEAFGEDPDAAARAAKVEEAIPIIDGLLRGETVSADGPTYVVREGTLPLRPVQQPRPPIWVGGTRPAALRRAARWDGWIALAAGFDGTPTNAASPAQIGADIDRVRAERERLGRSAAPFDVACLGFTDPSRPEDHAAYARAGVTWWLESLSESRGTFDELLAIVEAGPPAA